MQCLTIPIRPRLPAPIFSNSCCISRISCLHRSFDLPTVTCSFQWAWRPSESTVSTSLGDIWTSLGSPSLKKTAAAGSVGFLNFGLFLDKDVPSTISSLQFLDGDPAFCFPFISDGWLLLFSLRGQFCPTGNEQTISVSLFRWARAYSREGLSISSKIPQLTCETILFARYQPFWMLASLNGF